jgi:hypothetical protein
MTALMYAFIDKEYLKVLKPQQEQLILIVALLDSAHIQAAAYLGTDNLVQ